MIEFVGSNDIRVKVASDRKEAILELDKGFYDLVIVDLGLPDGSGFEICEYIKVKNLDIPIIINTGKDLSKLEEKKLKQYADSVIIKTASSQNRLLRDVDMFMHRVRIQHEPSSKDISDIDLTNRVILAVDDDIRNIYVLTEILGSKNAEVLTASNGQEAVDILKENPNTDMVLMDIMMPVMDGYEATSVIRKDERFKDLPIIALTAKAMAEDRLKAIDAGCDDYITKPLKKEMLYAMINGWLRK